MDPLTLGVGIAAVAGLGAAGRMRWRARQAEALADGLRRELRAERHAASHDALTGLPNRRAFYQLGSALVADPARHPLIAVMFDLDGFKYVNDNFGHAAGDQVLVTVAQRFATFAGDNLVARLGGDEFAGLLTSQSVDVPGLQQAAWSLADALAAPMWVTGRGVQITASVGLVPVHGCNRLDDILHRADGAMYRAKTSGRGIYLAPIALFRAPHAEPEPWPGSGPAARPYQAESHHAPAGSHHTVAHIVGGPRSVATGRHSLAAGRGR
jgi:diguanylate cyclase (GGDEF)-like protein